MADKKLISRLKIIVKEVGGQNKFAAGASSTISQSMLSRILKGDREINADLILTCCVTYGYNPEWLILGTGHKNKESKEGVKLLTEIQYFRTELKINNKRIDLVMARLKGVEKELEELKNGVKNGGN